MSVQKRTLLEDLDFDDDDDFPPMRRRKRLRHELKEEEVAEEEKDGENGGEEAAGEVKVKADEAEDEGGEEDCVPDDDDDDDDVKKEENSDGSLSSSGEEKPEYVFVELPNIRKDVQCPICLGIIKKTRTVMECLHRFCRECIDKSMRMGNNECPACRTHCPSRRSLRDDPNYDALIAALYPDIEKYEEEELAFHEEEKNRNKQIQESIARIFQRQEALNKRRSLTKDTTGAYVTRSQRNNRTVHSRKRRNGRGYEAQGSDENEDENENDVDKNSSSTDDRCIDLKPRRGRRRRQSLPSSSAVNSDGVCMENDLELGRESRGISPGLVWNPERLAWGRGGTRSHTRHGSASGCTSRSARNTRLSKLIDYLRSLETTDDELDVHFMLVSLDKQRTPSLHLPYLCCRPSLSVRHLREYVALKTPLEAEEVEILMVKGHCNDTDNQSIQDPSASVNNLNSMPKVDDPCKNVQILEGQETLAALHANCTSNGDHLILGYRQKETAASS